MLTRRVYVCKQVSVASFGNGSCDNRAGFLGKYLKTCFVTSFPGKYFREESRGRFVKLQDSVYVFCAHGKQGVGGRPGGGNLSH